MNWLSNFARPGLSKKKPEDARETPDNLWIKDPLSGDLIYRAELEQADWVTPSGFHMRIGPDARFKVMFDDQAWQTIPLPKVENDPLKFKDDKKYADRLKSARAKVHREDCMAAGYGRIGGAHAVVLVQDFEFMGGSLGMAAGEAFIAAAEAAVRRKAAMIIVTSSGGARMQEGILSLMQMPRTTLAIQMLRDAGLPYLVVLADPTTGGVTASYAMLGDVHIAEPGALIGFAGPRVIEQTIRQKLPEGFQRSEYLLDKGMVDMVVDRRKLRTTIATLLTVLMHKRAAVQGDSGEIEFADTNVEELPKGKRKPAKQAAPPTAKAAE
ncbi:MAG: acetyl-CoA carboxylase, carboxyltransferase subunit beta [Hyphomonadaceae bacterium]|nr:acetyl-CoA carboxylase, carboxyltransferase subunit beta [Hyphomonadaceae bacterium]